MLQALRGLRHKALRNFNDSHIKETFTTLTGNKENELFHGCTFDKVAGLTLKDCVLTDSKFVTKGVENALGFTVTLDCHSFTNVELSDDLFDLLLLLLCKGKGNTDKRRKLLFDVIGKERAAELLDQMKHLER